MMDKINQMKRSLKKKNGLCEYKVSVLQDEMCFGDVLHNDMNIDLATKLYA